MPPVSPTRRPVAQALMCVAKAPMVYARRVHILVVLDGELHAVGGFRHHGAGAETFVEKYDIRADSWSAMPGMAEPPNMPHHGWAAATSYLVTRKYSMLLMA